MALIQHHRTLLSGSITAGNQAVIGSFDLSNEGPGLSNIDNVDITAFAHVIEHGSSLTHGHHKVSGLFKRIGGTLSFLIGTYPEFPNDGDQGGGWFTLFFDVSGSILQVKAISAGGGDSPKNFAGIMNVYVFQ